LREIIESDESGGFAEAFYYRRPTTLIPNLVDIPFVVQLRIIRKEAEDIAVLGFARKRRVFTIKEDVWSQVFARNAGAPSHISDMFGKYMGNI
jgi:hypothetical protein